MQGFGLGMRLGMTYKDLRQLVGIHPTVAEEITLLQTTKRQVHCCSSAFFFAVRLKRLLLLVMRYTKRPQASFSSCPCACTLRFLPTCLRSSIRSDTGIQILCIWLSSPVPASRNSTPHTSKRRHAPHAPSFLFRSGDPIEKSGC